MNRLQVALDRISVSLAGEAAGDPEIARLRAALPAHLLPDWLLETIRARRLGRVELELDAGQDKSGLGVCLHWLTPDQIISEACECEPGRSVVEHGFLPVAGCAIGSGDPYFLDLRNGSSDPPLVRIPHDYAVTSPYRLEKIELVTETLSALFEQAKIT